MAQFASLISIRVIVEHDETLEENREIFLIDEGVEAIIRDALKSPSCAPSNISVRWESTEIISLDECSGCGRCAKCNRWTQDAEGTPKTDTVGICPGAFVDGKLLCDDCLPPDHPIAF